MGYLIYLIDLIYLIHLLYLGIRFGTTTVYVVKPVLEGSVLVPLQWKWWNMCARDLFWYHYSVCGETGFGGIKPTTSEKIDSLTQAKRFWGNLLRYDYSVCDEISCGGIGYGTRIVCVVETGSWRDPFWYHYSVCSEPGVGGIRSGTMTVYVVEPVLGI